jgi:hypothetical protein
LPQSFLFLHYVFSFFFGLLLEPGLGWRYAEQEPRSEKRPTLVFVAKHVFILATRFLATSIAFIFSSFYFPSF